jgi:hypothetical protein
VVIYLKRETMKVIETRIVWSTRYEGLVKVYGCQPEDSLLIEYYAEFEGELWKPSEFELKELLKQQ